MKTKLQITFFLLFVLLTSLSAQTIPQKDTLSNISTRPKLSVPSDSTLLASRPIRPRPSRDSAKAKVKYSEDALEEPVDFEARDSQWIDAKNREVHLFGAAKVTYEQLVLTADYIVLNLDENIATAEGLPDSLGRMSGTPEFDDGSQKFNAKKLRYNFKSGKGIIYDGTTQQNDLFLLGQKTKYISKNNEKEELEKKEDVVYTSGATLTTCNHSKPHFGFRCKKIKIVPDRVAIAGPSNLEIAGVATPIVIPFGFFPISKQKQTGLLQGDFDISQTLGFGLQQWGWYFPLSDQYDLVLRGDIYSRGSFRINGQMNYKKRYKFNGSFNLFFSNLRVEPSNSIETVSDRSFRIAWRHNQDQNAHPTRNFSGSLNFQTNDNQSRNLNDPDAVLENIIGSNLNFTQRFPDKPFTLTASFNHSQNTATRSVRVDFPTVNFQTQTLQPFKSKKPAAGNREKWFEKISVRYSSRMQNTLTGTDTTFFSQETLQDAQFGIKHDIDVDANFNAFKYFTLTPSVSIDENWYFNFLERQLDPTLTIDSTEIFAEPGSEEVIGFELDTVGYGTVEDMIRFGFKPLHLFNVRLDLTTRIFGTLLFKKGPLRGLRHVIAPTIGLAFTPDYTSDFFGYFRTVDTDVREFDDDRDIQQYSIFEQNIFDRPSNAGKTLNITYGFNNLFEGKYYSKKDSTEKKFKILNRVNVNGRYNLAADSVRFSAISVSGNGNFFKGITTLNFNMSFDPHELAEDGTTRINKLVISERGKLFRFVNANFNLSSSFTVKKLRELIRGKSQTTGGNAGGNRDGPPGQGNRGVQVEDVPILDWIENFSIRHELRFSVNRISDRDTFQITTNNIRIQGNLQLTKNWRLDIRNISYDIKSKQFTFPSLGFSRDLHCW
ncbi:MAG: putative LPS assembly protein LptD, partial [Bacteroidota bacterium]